MRGSTVPRMFSLLLAVAPAAQQATEKAGPDRRDLAGRLMAAVDLPSSKARRKAADALAKLDVKTATWLAIMESFGAFEAVPAGAGRETVDLPVLGGVESTRIDYFVPTSYDPTKPSRLMMAAHGTGGRGAMERSIWRALAEELGMIVLAPTEAGANDGYRFSKRERASAMAVLRWARRRFNVDERRVFVSGTSRGGHLAWDLALRYPDRFAGIAPFIGGPRWNLAEGQNNLRYTENLVGVSIRDLQGVGDDPRMLFNLRWAFDRLRKVGAKDAQLFEQAGHGHSYDFGAVDWAGWLRDTVRPALPVRIVRLAAVKEEARSGWAEITRLDSKVKESFRAKVKAREWSALDDEGRRRLLQRQADERTARLEIEMRKPGDFVGKKRGVRGWRVLLTEAMLDDKRKVAVRVGSSIKHARVGAEPNPRVLLREFVERFDRTFLPIAEVRGQ